MKSFTIDAENNITAFAKSKDAKAARGDTFRSEAELHQLTDAWSASRLVEIWNSIPGLAPIKKFKDRKTAVGRIWKAIQNLDGGVSAQAANVASAENTAGTQAKPAQKETRAARGARSKKADQAAEPAATPTAEAPVARPATKTARVLAMLRRPEGATLQQIMRATGWQAHSVRGFISGTVGRKMGLRIESSKAADGGRIRLLVVGSTDLHSQVVGAI